MEIKCTICNHYSRTQEQHERHVVTEEHKKNTAIYENGLEAGLYRAEQLAAALEAFTHPDLSKTFGGNVEGDESIVFQRNAAILKLGHFRRARAALEAWKAAK